MPVRNQRKQAYYQALNRLCEKRVFSSSEEKLIFHKINQLRAEIKQTQSECNENSPDLQRQTAAINALRNRMMIANQRLLVKVARKFAGGCYSLPELVAEGELSLLRCVELFDVTRGYCFSTYLTNALQNLFSRMLQREQKRLARYAGRNELSASLPDQQEFHRREEQFLFVSQLMQHLSGRERIIIEARFGLGEFDKPHTYRQIGSIVGLSKERVRVLAHRSIDKLSEHVNVHDVCMIVR